MSLTELVEQEGIDLNDVKLISLLQKFYSEGYFQGINDKNPNYEYSLKYRQLVERVLNLFELTLNPNMLLKLEKCLDNLDNFRKDNNI